MGKIAIATDSNSGITQSEATELGIHVIPMPFYSGNKTYYEEIDLSQDEFYDLLQQGVDISTSMPIVGEVVDFWEDLLAQNDEILYIPMSSGLSSSCEAALLMAKEYEDKVQVVDNQRISVTMRQSVLDAKKLADAGKTAIEIRDFLEKVKFESSIYIMVDTMTYLKKGGRVTATAATLGTLLKIKPVLQIQGDKLDLYGKARSLKLAKAMMCDQLRKDFKERFDSEDGAKMNIAVAYTKNIAPANEFRDELQLLFPDQEIVVRPLSLSISCHIGPGALAVACSKKMEYL